MKIITTSLIISSLLLIGCSSGSGTTNSATDVPNVKSSGSSPTESKGSTPPTDSKTTDASAKPTDPKKDISEAELGVPFYPGSEYDAKGNNFKSVTDAVKEFDTQRTTTDTAKQVADFYMGKIKGAKMVGAGDTYKVDGKLDSGAAISCTASKQDGKTLIIVTSFLKK